MMVVDFVPSILNVSFYRFVALGDLTVLRQDLKAICFRLKLKGTIILSPEGINLFLAGSEEAIREIQGILQQVVGGSSAEPIRFKESWSVGQPFKRMRVKLKQEIIPFGVPGIRPALKTGARIEAKELKRWLDEGKEVVLLDTRNQFEVELGTFKNAVNPAISKFRQFPDYLKANAKALSPKPVVMFCTGGIRCEKATAYALELGLDNVFQLEGGILKYFEECGNDHYNGTCFVFDERVALDGELKPEIDQVI